MLIKLSAYMYTAYEQAGIEMIASNRYLFHTFL